MDEFAVIVAPRTFLNVDMVQGDKTETVRMDVYPSGAAGSWVLYRSKKDEKPVRIIFYFNQNSEVYVQFTPYGEKSLADLVVFGSYAARSVPLGIDFSRFYTASFKDVLRWTEYSLPWKNVNVITGQYSQVFRMASEIRKRLSEIDFAEDACYNEKGELYAISTGKPFEIRDEDSSLNINDIIPDYGENRLTLGSAGFVKWIVDGIVSPLTGKGTSIEKMLDESMTFDSLGKNGVLSQTYNLTFTLDWCRNLAASALSVRSSRDYDWKSGGVDVKAEPFAADMTSGTLKPSLLYTKDAGYSLSGLKSLLYVLAVREPSYFYLAAVRRQSKISPDEFVFNECAVLFPFFDDNGKFGVFVFEKNRELTLENFISEYEGDFVHLERVKTTDMFKPL